MSDSAADLGIRFLKLDADPDRLESELGARLKASASDPALANAPPGQFQVAEADLSLAGDVAELGRRLYRRMMKEFYGVVCGDGDAEAGDRDKIKQALGIGSDDVIVAAIAGILAGSFGLAAAPAGIVAVLILKRIVKPGGEELCEFWKEKMSE